MEQASYNPEHHQPSIFSLSTSLVIHLGIILLCLYKSVDQSVIPFLTSPQQEDILPLQETEKELPAALLPRASAFGLPLQFSDEEWGDHDELSSIEKEYAQNDQHDNAQQGILQASKSDEKDHNEPSTIIPGITIEQSEKKEPDVPNGSTHSSHSQLQGNSEIKKEIQNMPVQQASSGNLRKKHEEMKDLRKRVTFADLAQGFIENMTHEGSDAFKRHGDPSKRPDQEDLKKISYYQKVIWAIQNELKIAQDQLKIPPQHYFVGLQIIIGAEGQLLGVKVAQASGNSVYDNFILDGVRRAAPFNPIPKHFDSTTCTIMLGIECTFMREPMRVHMGAYS